MRPWKLGRADHLYDLGPVLEVGSKTSLRLARRTGAGGFSRDVVVKMLHTRLALDEGPIAELVREALVGARLRHPNVVPVLDLMTLEGCPALVRPFIDGVSLERLRALRRDIPMSVGASIAADVVRGVVYAHSSLDRAGRRLSHGSLSAKRVLLGRDGVSRVTGFGAVAPRGTDEQRRISDVHAIRRLLDEELAEAVGEVDISSLEQRLDAAGFAASTRSVARWLSAALAA